jgi:hypothetical protein
MSARQTHQCRFNLKPGGLLGAFHGTRDRLRRRGEVNDHAFANPIGRLDPHTENANRILVLDAPDESAYFGCANVNAYNNLFHNY